MLLRTAVSDGWRKQIVSSGLRRCPITGGNATTENEFIKAYRNEAVLYVHWPYCARRCTYCNFNKYISGSVDHSRMCDCLCREAETLIKLSGVTQINSIFFGGGTPSLALPSTVSRIVDTVKRLVSFKPGSEITLEANPTRLETERLLAFKHAGVNRISLGVQALRKSDLQVLGRDHDVEDALRCLEEAKKLYPGRVSLDIIFGLPGQTIEDWEQELKQVIDVCDNHVSLYQLTLERGTQLFKWVQEKKHALPDTDIMAEMYRTAVNMLEDHRFYRYEVSNFARMGAESKHNEAYWQGMQYIGIGPGAHGRFIPQNRLDANSKLREARIQTLEPDNWMFEVEKYGHATRKKVTLSLQDQIEELISLGLRTVGGVSTRRWEALCGKPLKVVFGENKNVCSLAANGFLVLDDSGIRATSEGLTVLDSIVPHLLAAMTDKHT